MDGLWSLAIAVGLFGLWSVISPRSQWWVLRGWTYRDPEANEPSDALYVLMRLGGLVTLGVVVWLVVSSGEG